MQDIVLDEVYGVWFTSFWQTWPGYATLMVIGVTGLSLMVMLVWGVRHYLSGTSKDKALRSLKALSERVKREKADVRQSYYVVTDITKQFLQWRYTMPSGMTDYELIQFMNKVDCDQDDVKLLEKVLTDSQVVKFGSKIVARKYLLDDIAKISAFISKVGDPNKHEEGKKYHTTLE